MSYISLRNLGSLNPTPPRYLRFQVGENSQSDNLSQQNIKPMPIDLSEQEKQYRVKANLPGFSREEINISLDEHLLVIEAKKQTKSDEQNRYLQSERYQGSYQRRINLSEQCDLSKISAELSNGVLTIDLPKIAEAPLKKIKID